MVYTGDSYCYPNKREKKISISISRHSSFKLPLATPSGLLLHPIKPPKKEKPTTSSHKKISFPKVVVPKIWRETECLVDLARRVGAEKNTRVFSIKVVHEFSNCESVKISDHQALEPYLWRTATNFPSITRGIWDKLCPFLLWPDLGEFAANRGGFGRAPVGQPDAVERLFCVHGQK